MRRGAARSLRCAHKCFTYNLRGFVSHARKHDGVEEFGHQPKVELHRHLEGAVRLTTVLDLAKEHGVSLPHGPSGDLTAPKDITLEGIRPHIQSLSPFQNLEALLDIFNYTQSTFGAVEVFHRIGYEAVLDAHAEGIKLIELRYAPSFCSIGNNFAFEDVLKAVKTGVKAGQDHLGGKDAIGVGLICIGVGAMGPEEMRKTTDFFLDNQDAFCGFDMAGAESDVLQHADCFARVREAGARITCHASEDLVEGVPENAINAVKVLGAERIGHGIQIIKDKAIMNQIRDHDILLEVSVTSNWLTAAIGPDLSDHPVKRLWQYGIKVQPNTDDPGIMGIDLNNEWHIWKHVLGFSDEELHAMQLLALERSFLPLEEKERLWSLHFSPLGNAPTMGEDIMGAKEVHCAAAARG